MNFKKSKYLLTLGALGATVAPLAFTISCGSKSEAKTVQVSSWFQNTWCVQSWGGLTSETTKDASGQDHKPFNDVNMALGRNKDAHNTTFVEGAPHEGQVLSFDVPETLAKPLASDISAAKSLVANDAAAVALKNSSYPTKKAWDDAIDKAISPNHLQSIITSVNKSYKVSEIEYSTRFKIRLDTVVQIDFKAGTTGVTRNKTVYLVPKYTYWGEVIGHGSTDKKTIDALPKPKTDTPSQPAGPTLNSPDDISHMDQNQLMQLIMGQQGGQTQQPAAGSDKIDIAKTMIFESNMEWIETQPKYQNPDQIGTIRPWSVKLKTPGANIMSITPNPHSATKDNTFASFFKQWLAYNDIDAKSKQVYEWCKELNIDQGQVQ